MSILIGQEKTNLTRTGRTTHVPDYDVCRLSYYLNCGTKSCDLDIIVDELVDFKNAHRLPQERQDAIFKLAATDFDLEKLANVTIFLDDDHQLLPRSQSNAFYKIEKISHLFAVQNQAMLAGQQKQVRNIMVCDQQWLTKNYLNPLKRNEHRVRRALQSSLETQLLQGLVELLIDDDTDHCSHCKGKESLCACKEGCPTKSSSKCTAASNHCNHCRGSDGTCACTDGCPPKTSSQCHVVHKDVRCDACMQPSIKGTRYNCQSCFNYDLCGSCYMAGAHDETHPFARIERVGSTPQTLSPRQAPPPPRRPSPPPSKTTFAEATFTHPPPTAPHGDIPMATAVPVDGAFHEGQSVRLSGMSDPKRNGCVAVVVKTVGDRVVIQITGEDKKITVKAENLETIASIIPLGTLVELKGLSKPDLNGQLAAVVEDPTIKPGRVAVKLLDNEERILSIKPENCDTIEEVG